MLRIVNSLPYCFARSIASASASWELGEPSTATMILANRDDGIPPRDGRKGTWNFRETGSRRPVPRPGGLRNRFYG